VVAQVGSDASFILSTDVLLSRSHRFLYSAFPLGWNRTLSRWYPAPHSPK